MNNTTPEPQPPITPEQLKHAVEGLGTFAWQAGYLEFCYVLGFDSQSSYARDKWTDWKHLQKGLGTFDLNNLLKLITAGHAVPINLGTGDTPAAEQGG